MLREAGRQQPGLSSLAATRVVYVLEEGMGKGGGERRGRGGRRGLAHLLSLGFRASSENGTVSLFK